MLARRPPPHYSSVCWQVEVNLVDYGKLVTVEKLKIRTIDDGSIWSLPYQVCVVNHNN